MLFNTAILPQIPSSTISTFLFNFLANKNITFNVVDAVGYGR